MTAGEGAFVLCWRCHAVSVLYVGKPCRSCQTILEAEYDVQRAANGGKLLYLPDDFDGPFTVTASCESRPSLGAADKRHRTLLRTVVVGLLFVLVGFAPQQGPPPPFAIVAPVIPGDTNSHVDALVGKTVQLAVNDTGKVTWSSGNPSVASVTTKGLLTAKARGYATITATRGTSKATIRACASAVETELLTFKEVGRTVTAAQTSLVVLKRTTVTQHVALQVTGATAWGSCIHWWIAPRADASIDRAGVLHASESIFPVVASIGTRLP